MKRQPVADVPISQIISAMLNAEVPLPAGAAPSEPSESKQITPPTADQQKEMEDLASTCCDLNDEIASLVGEKLSILKTKRDALKTLMLNHGVSHVPVGGRKPVTLSKKSEKDTTKKAITVALGAEDAGKLWNKLPTKTSFSVSLPEPAGAPPGA